MTSSLLNDNRIARLIEIALIEDGGMGDLTSDAVIDEAALSRGSCSANRGG